MSSVQQNLVHCDICLDVKCAAESSSLWHLSWCQVCSIAASWNMKCRRYGVTCLCCWTPGSMWSATTPRCEATSPVRFKPPPQCCTTPRWARPKPPDWEWCAWTSTRSGSLCLVQLCLVHLVSCTAVSCTPCVLYSSVLHNCLVHLLSCTTCVLYNCVLYDHYSV